MRALIWLAASMLGAQTPPPDAAPAQTPAKPVLQFAGKPMALPFQCSEEDRQSFGISCSPDEPCPVYLELAAVESAGVRLFAAGNLHTRETTMFSVLLASEDNGKTWTEAYERIKFAGLDQIQFIDFEGGWIAGQMLQTLPRDPFFLITTDGGKLWRRKPVFGGDSRVGSIEAFHFDSRQTGSLLIDRSQSGEAGSRHELYETMTGGRHLDDPRGKFEAAQAETRAPAQRRPSRAGRRGHQELPHRAAHGGALGDAEFVPGAGGRLPPA